jgi:hypothetical protein
LQTCPLSTQKGTRKEPSPLRYAALVIIAIASAAVYSRFIPGTEDMTTPDSAGYVFFGIDRSIGYPLFITVVKLLTGTIAHVPVAQIALLAAAFLFLAWQFLKYTNSLAISVLLQASLFTNPIVLKNSGMLMSETVGIALSAIFLGCVLNFNRSLSTKDALAALLFACMCYTVRPISIALLVAAAVIVILDGRLTRAYRMAAAVAIIVGVAVAHLATPVYRYATTGSPRVSSPLARGLFAKAIYLPHVPEHMAPECHAEFIDSAMAPARSYITSAPRYLTRYLEQQYADYMRFEVIIPRLSSVEQDPDDALRCYAMGRIGANPMGFASSWLDEYWAALTLEPFLPPAHFAEARAYLAENRPPLPVASASTVESVSVARRLDAELGIARKAHDIPQQRAVFTTNGAFASTRPFAATAIHWALVVPPVVMALGVLGYFVATFRRNSIASDLMPLACAAIAFHAEMAITAISEFSLARYWSYGWPLICVAMALTVFVARDRLIERPRGRSSRRVQMTNEAPSS